MKTLKTILCTLFLSALVIAPIEAQGKKDTKNSWFDSNCGLDYPWSVSIGLGVGFSTNDKNNKATYFERHDQPLGQSWRAEVRRKHFGLEYLLNYNSLEDDRLLTQYFALTATTWHMFGNKHQLVYAQASAGLLNYQQSLIKRSSVQHSTMAYEDKNIYFSKNYFGVGLGGGYKVSLYKRWALDTKLEIIIGDAGGGFEPQEEESYWLEGTLTFIHLTVALQLGW